jgi:colicin import membrane protein
MRARAITTFVFGSLISLSSAATAQELDQEVRELNWIGFQQLKDVSRVFVRTTEPVKYKVDNSRGDVIVILLENTTVPLKNNTRQLDTRFFESPVSYIQAKVIEGPSPSVRVEIRVRRKVPFKEAQTDNVLALDFQRQ